MRLILDKELCVGCGLCEENLDTLFRMNGQTAELIADEVPDALLEEVRNTIDDCPAEAISLEE
jgi:ferredoxin